MKGYAQPPSKGWEFFSNWKSAQRVTTDRIRIWADNKRRDRKGDREKLCFFELELRKAVKSVKEALQATAQREIDDPGQCKYVISVKSLFSRPQVQLPEGCSST